MQPTPPQPAVAVEALFKSFSGVRVLEGISFDIRSGEVHTLMGENGAGKSTLMKILAGVHQPDSGSLRLAGREVALHSPQAALQRGIALIHQEPLSFPDLSVAENIFMGRGMPRRAGLLDWPAMNRRAKESLDSLGVKLDPRTKVRGLSVADQQMVELAAALSQQASVLLMDEPTAALTPREVEDLFAIVRRLRAAGTAIVFISHRLPEVFTISDRITVLRDGLCIGTREVAATNPDEIIRMMVGRELGQLYEKTAAPIGATRLMATGLGRRGAFEGVSLQLRAGEIVGLAGLVGAGRTDVGRALFGVAPADAGTIQVDGRQVAIRNPQDAARHKIAYVPEDRARHGLFGPMSIAANTAMAHLPSISALGWLLGGRQRALAESWKQKLRIRLRDVDQPVRELSGGNQQKVVLAKWLTTEPEVLILDEPTRGVDVGAKAEVHHLMAELARQGKAILMISSDLPEVLAMSDRILVMREGRPAGEFTREHATQENIMAAATGQGRHGEQTSARARKTNALGATMMKFRELGIAVVVICVVLGVTLLQRWHGRADAGFLSQDNMMRIIRYVPLFIIIGMGQMMVIITRNIDLSVGAIVGFAALVVGNLYLSHPDMPVAVAALAGCAVGAVLGLVNGILVAYCRVPSIIATLGTLTAYRGLLFIYSGARQVSSMPHFVVELSQTSPIFGLPWLIIFALAVTAIAGAWLRYSGTGREIFALGSNPAAAVLRGIPVSRILMVVFILTGILSGFCGLLFAAQTSTVNPGSAGKGMELGVISAVVIGGTNVFGGSGSALGTLLGCLLLGVVNVALTVLDVEPGWQLAIYGVVILMACITDTLIQRSAGTAAEAL